MRKITAKDVKPGMTIEWTDGGWKHSGTVKEVQELNRGSLFTGIKAAGGAWQTLELDQEVTVLSEPQPNEPTAFGAAVEVADVKYVRIAPRGLTHFDPRPWLSDSGTRHDWGNICDDGPVEVKPNPFATPAQDDTEPRVWDCFDDVPYETPFGVDGINGRLRKKAPLIEVSYQKTKWQNCDLMHSDMRSYGPFTEVRDA